MKINTLILFSILCFTSCINNTQNEPLAANEKIAGKWLMDGSPNYGKGYMAGDQKDLETVKKFMDAYEIWMLSLWWKCL